MSTSHDNEELIDRLGDEFTARCHRGERPDPKDYADRYPQVAEQILDLFPVLAVMEKAAPDIASDSDSTAPGAMDHQDTTCERGAPSRLGDYCILREIGRGGMGVVYEAQQESLGRRVALKVLRPGMLDKGKSRVRFHREARAAARLHHTNIVPVFEIGQEGDNCYYAMQFIDGQPLDDVIAELVRLRSSPDAGGQSDGPAAARPALSLAHGQFRTADLLAEQSDPAGSSVEDMDAPPGERRGPAAGHAQADSSPSTAGSSGQLTLSGVSGEGARHAHYFVNVAHIARQAAEALSYAHARGMVHRDIKPSNLLLDMSGVVWVTDFGLVKVEDDGLTGPGEMVGTLRYMSPERFRGQCDARSDVYALGATLYELLTLRPAFDSGDRLRLFDEVCHRNPLRPRAIDHRIPRDLETIALKAMDKDPGCRYQTAEAMAAELRRFIADEPIEARRVSPVERFARWARRHKGLAASVSTIAALLLLVTFLALAAAAASKEREKSALALTDALRERLSLARQTRYDTEMGVLNGVPRSISEPLVAREEMRSPLGEKDERGFEWSWPWRSGPEPIMTCAAHRRGGASLAVSPDGEYLACSGNLDLKIIEVATGKVVRTMQGHPGGISHVAWSPNGQFIASTDWDGFAIVWDAAKGSMRHFLRVDSCRLAAADWSPDSTRVAVGGGFWGRAAIVIFDAKTGQHCAEFPCDPQRGESPLSLDWHPDGKRIAVGRWNSTVQTIDAQTGKVLRDFPSHWGPVFCLAWSPDGKRLASSGGDKWIRVCDGDTGAQIFHGPTPHREQVWALAWNSDGKTLASAATGFGSDKDRTIRTWHSEAGEGPVIYGYSAGFHALCWLPGSYKIAAASESGNVRVWDLASEVCAIASPQSKLSVREASWTQDMTRVAVLFEDGSVKIWDIQAKKWLLELQGTDAKAVAVSLSRNGDLLAVATAGGGLQLREVKTGKVKHLPASQVKGALKVAFSPADSLLAVGLSTGTVLVLDPSTGERRQEFAATGGTIQTLAWHPKGQYLAASGETTIIVWDVTSGSRLGSTAVPKTLIKSLDFHPDDPRLLLAGGYSTTFVAPPQGGPTASTLPQLGVVFLWDPRSPEPPRVIGSPDSTESCAKWNRDGTRIVAADEAGNVSVWDGTLLENLDVDRRLLSLRASRVAMRSVAWKDHSMGFVSVDANGTVRHWDATPGYRLDRSPLLLPKLDHKLAANTASAEDLRLRWEVLWRKGETEAAKEAAVRAVQGLGDRRPDWVVMPWWIVGPYPDDLSADFPPGDEYDPREPAPPSKLGLVQQQVALRWKPANRDVTDFVDFTDYYARTDYTSRYAMTQVYAPQGQSVHMLFTPDDAGRVWLNGDPVCEQRECGKTKTVEIALRQGWNRLLVKTTNVNGNHYFTVRFSRDPVELAGNFEQAERWDDALRQWNMDVEASPKDAFARLKRGLVEIRLGLLDAAGADFASWGRSIPGVADRTLLADAYERSGHPEKAIAILEREVELAPERLHPRKRLAEVLLNVGRLPEAFAVLKQAVSKGPLDSGFLWFRGEVAIRLARWKDAESDFTKMVEQLPDKHFGRFATASVCLLADDENGYRRVCHEMLAESSGKQNPDIAEQTARVCLVFPAGGEDMSMAVRLAAQGVSARSDNAWNLLAQGMADYRTGQYADAVKRLGQSIQKSRSYGGYPRLDAVAHLFLAMAHHAQGRRSEAKEHLDSGRQVVLTEARQIRKRGFGEYWWDWMFPFVVYPQAVSLIEGTPESKVRAQLNVEIETGGPTASAQKLIDEKKLQEACALLTSALAKLPEDRDLLQLRGEVALRLGRWKDAECDLMKLIDRSGDKHWRRFQVASVCLLAGNEDAYRRLCREMLGESRARQEIAESTAKACLILPVGGDDLPTATRLAKGAITADPKFIWNILAQGMADCRNGQHGAAVEGLNQAIERNAPQRIHSLDAIAHLFLAMAYHAQHQQDEAKKHLDAGRQLVLEEARGIRNRGFRDSWWDWTTAFFVYPQAVSLVEGAPESKVRAQINAEIEAGGQ